MKRILSALRAWFAGREMGEWPDLPQTLDEYHARRRQVDAEFAAYEIKTNVRRREQLRRYTERAKEIGA